ncbi:MAG: hypothetical protein J0M29_09840 [Chitinophagales bacterium]|nr:hypothetical protein [Chitinophagales bacterium]HLP94612.1 hypothetical protein [Saprospiraceae bacterium]
MSTDDRIRNRRSFRMPLLILGISMTVFYLGMGGWLLLDKSFIPDMQVEFRNIFAIMLLVYGTYRGWRVYADYF